MGWVFVDMKIKTDVIRLGKYLKPQLVSRPGEWLWALWLACCPWQWLRPAFPLKCKQVLFPTLPGRKFTGQNCSGGWPWPQWLDHALFMLVAEVNADCQKPGEAQEILDEFVFALRAVLMAGGEMPFSADMHGQAVLGSTHLELHD